MIYCTDKLDIPVLLDTIAVLLHRAHYTHNQATYTRYIVCILRLARAALVKAINTTHIYLCVCGRREGRGKGEGKAGKPMVEVRAGAGTGEVGVVAWG